MGEVFRGIRLRDVLLAGALTALGVVLMYADVVTTDADVAGDIVEGGMVHATDSHSPWMIPLFAVASVAVLWWRRNLLVVATVALAAMVAHDLVFGWVTRCGAGLPLVFVLTFLGAMAYDRTRAVIVLGLSVLLTVAVLVIDSTTGPSAIALALPVVAVVFGIGRAVRHRSELNHRLELHDAELRRLRDQRAALAVADDRARWSEQLDGLLQERLDQLSAAAGSAEGLDPVAAKAVLETIETDGRQTLQDMREIVGLLRGGEVDLAPVPTVAHLGALLARRQPDRSRLTVAGEARTLPATVELSAYRIVEYLITVLADRTDAPIEVGIRFTDDALELRVHGPVSRRTDVRAAVARSRERARLLGGSVEVKVGRGQARAVAHLPVGG